MRIRILLLTVMSAFFLFSAVLYSAEPLVRFYLNDGSTKQYNLSEIDSLGIIDQKNNYVMRIHYDDTKVAYYPTEIIGSIKFEKDDIQRDILNVYIFSYPKPYKISSIDSLVFYIDQYQPLTIGTQVWMLKNLNVDRYRNGQKIQTSLQDTIWRILINGAWCYYNNDPKIGAIYGKLYNWYAVIDTNGLAPKGWHIPSDAEWKTLTDYLGGDSVSGGKLKNTGTIEANDGLWNTPNYGATNESGFSALPGGVCYDDGLYFHLGNTTSWWSVKEYNPEYAMHSVSFDISRSKYIYYSKYSMHSVRCVKDGK